MKITLSYNISYDDEEDEEDKEDEEDVDEMMKRNVDEMMKRNVDDDDDRSFIYTSSLYCFATATGKEEKRERERKIRTTHRVCTCTFAILQTHHFTNCDHMKPKKNPFLINTIKFKKKKTFSIFISP